MDYSRKYITYVCITYHSCMEGGGMHLYMIARVFFFFCWFLSSYHIIHLCHTRGVVWEGVVRTEVPLYHRMRFTVSCRVSGSGA